MAGPIFPPAPRINTSPFNRDIIATSGSLGSLSKFTSPAASSVTVVMRYIMSTGDATN
jgi:hypothetical protein